MAGTYARRGAAVPAEGLLRVAQERADAGLLNVPVGRERLPRAALSHVHERGAVDEAPFLVWPRREQVPRSLDESEVDLHDADRGVAAEPVDQPGRGAPPAERRQPVSDFKDDPGRCRERVASLLSEARPARRRLGVLVRRDGEAIANDVSRNSSATRHVPAVDCPPVVGSLPRQALVDVF